MAHGPRSNLSRKAQVFTWAAKHTNSFGAAMETNNVTISRNTQVRPGPDVLVSQLCDELVFLDLAS